MADAVQDASGESLGHLAPAMPPQAEVLSELRRPNRFSVHPGYMAMLAILIVFPFVTPSGYSLTVLTEILVFALFAVSLDIILGYTGMPSFGHAAFFGLGAYGTAVLTTKVSVSNLGLTLLLTLALCVAAALIVGWLAIRTSGVYFLMLTLAFAQMIFAGAQKWTRLTGGTNGLPGVHKPDVFVPGLTTSEPRSFYFLVLAIFALSFFLLHRLVNSPFGRSLIGIRENESRMRAMGYNIRAYKLTAFVIAGAFGGVAGMLYAYYNSFVSPTDVYWTVSGTVLLMVLIGGAGTLIGPVLGAAFFLVLQNVLSSLTERWPIILGAVFIVVILFVRSGLVGIWTQLMNSKFNIQHSTFKK